MPRMGRPLPPSHTETSLQAKPPVYFKIDGFGLQYKQAPMSLGKLTKSAPSAVRFALQNRSSFPWTIACNGHLFIYLCWLTPKAS